jgi:hypothetical protein
MNKVTAAKKAGILKRF